MAIAFERYSGAQNNTVLIAAEPDRVIRVIKVLITTWANVKVQLLSDPGAQSTPLTPFMQVSNTAPLGLHLGRSLAWVTERGKALGITTTFQASAGEHSIVVWYEVVS